MGTPYSRQAARTKDGATSGSVGGRRLILALEVFNNAEVEIFLRPEACSGLEVLENAPESQSSFSDEQVEITELEDTDRPFLLPDTESPEVAEGRPLSSPLL